MTPEKPRTMIIVWRWEELNAQKPFDIVNVVKSPNNKIIRIVNNDKPLLIEHTNTALQKGHTFVFLHRNHGFKKEDIPVLIKQLKTDKNRPHKLKFFLFGDGLDYLYFDTQDEGLLDHDGYFMYEPEYGIEEEDENGKMIIQRVSVSVVQENEETKKDEVKLEHFDRVWEYYKGEFHKKINELMVDFVTAFVDLENTAENDRQKSPLEWKTALKGTDNRNGQYLNIRIKSFIENANDFERNSLKEFERQEGYSFIFDDCKGNFQGHEKISVRKYYKQLYEKLTSIYSDKTEKAFSLNQLRSLFLKLLQEIK